MGLSKEKILGVHIQLQKRYVIFSEATLASRIKSFTLQEKLNTLIFMAQACSGMNDDICINLNDSNLPWITSTSRIKIRDTKIILSSDRVWQPHPI